MMRRFRLRRHEDVTGISGVGVVAEGVEFASGKVALQWCVPGMPSSVAVWDAVGDILAIHGHDGMTRIEWVDSHG